MVDYRNAPKGNITIPFVGPGEVFAAGIILPVVGLAVIGLRFYTRKAQGTYVGRDDWAILCSWAFILIMGITLIWGTACKAFGYPTSPTPKNLTPAEAAYYVPPHNKLQQQLEFAFQIAQCLAYGITKISILFFYRRVFASNHSRPFDIAIVVSLVVVAIWTIVFTILSIFKCGSHFWAIWSSLLAQHQFCPIDFPVAEGLAISDTIMDVLIMALPFPLIWSLQLTTSKKVLLSGIFLLGFMATAASIVRLVVYLELIKTDGHPDEDPMLTITLALYWSMVEGGFALIAANLPPLGPLIRRFAPNYNQIRTFFLLPSTIRSKRSELGSEAQTQQIKQEEDAFVRPSGPTAVVDLSQGVISNKPSFVTEAKASKVSLSQTQAPDDPPIEPDQVHIKEEVLVFQSA